MFLYHHVPEGQIGDVIYPLNQLKVLYPDLYGHHYKKYDGLIEKDVKIPRFGYWNDCVNLMPVSPDLVKAELEKYGLDTNWEWRFYKINAQSLDYSKLIIMILNENAGHLQREFVQFNKEAFDKYCHIGKATRDCFKDAKDNNEQPNTFARIPHVLYKGAINTKNLEVIKF